MCCGGRAGPSLGPPPGSPTFSVTSCNPSYFTWVNRNSSSLSPLHSLPSLLLLPACPSFLLSFTGIFLSPHSLLPSRHSDGKSFPWHRPSTCLPALLGYSLHFCSFCPIISLARLIGSPLLWPPCLLLSCCYSSAIYHPQFLSIWGWRWKAHLSRLGDAWQSILWSALRAPAELRVLGKMTPFHRPLRAAGSSFNERGIKRPLEWDSP